MLGLLTCKEAGCEDNIPGPVGASNLTVELTGHIASDAWQVERERGSRKTQNRKSRDRK